MREFAESSIRPKSASESELAWWQRSLAGLAVVTLTPVLLLPFLFALAMALPAIPFMLPVVVAAAWSPQRRASVTLAKAARPLRIVRGAA